MRVNKYLVFYISLSLSMAFMIFYVNHMVHYNESAAKIRLLKELNFKPHKNKLTLDENPVVSKGKLETPEYISSGIDNHQQRIDEVIYEGLDFNFGETRSEIIKNLGEPLKITEKSVISRHRPELNDNLYDLVYEGLEARIYHVVADEKELVLRILIKSEKYKVKYGLNIGVTDEFVLKTLGPPAIKQKDLYEFNDSNGFAKLRFYFDSNILHRIEWNFEEN